jgi:hypothetical protein
MSHVEITFHFRDGWYVFASDDEKISIRGHNRDDVTSQFLKILENLTRNGATCRVEAYAPLGNALSPIRATGAICRVGLRDKSKPDPLRHQRLHKLQMPSVEFQEPSIRILSLDPTPAGLVGARSLRKAFKTEWARIRARHFKENGLSCALCKAVETERRLIHAHEMYSFPSPDIVQLERILFVCTRCHDAIHLERTRSRCGPTYVGDLEEHYCRVNGGISLDDLKKDRSEAARRSFSIREFYGGGNAAPKMDFGEYQVGVDETLKRKRKREIDDDDIDFEMFPDHECPSDVGKA